MMRLKREKDKWIKTERNKTESKVLENCTFKPKISRLKIALNHSEKEDKSYGDEVSLEKSNKMKLDFSKMNQLEEPDD